MTFGVGSETVIPECGIPRLTKLKLFPDAKTIVKGTVSVEGTASM
jgi:hypothetical protein